MPSFDLLDRAASDFEERLQLISDAQLGLPTPCEEMNVHDLVLHQINGMRRYTLLLNGKTLETDTGVVSIKSDDWLSAFRREYHILRAAFMAPGAMERTVAHPGMGDIPGSVLFEMRLAELEIHGWDLARAIGSDETLDPDVVADLWAFIEPMAEIMPGTGYFGSGPSGSVPDSAPLQARLLDLMGRRP